jgi:hypothetical protein
MSVIRNPALFTIECKTFEAGQTGYYLLSGDKNFQDDYAKWKCAYEMKFLKCPDFNIIPSDGKALINITRGSVEDYSKASLESCVVNSITNAPTELKPTSQDVKNRDSWSN